MRIKYFVLISVVMLSFVVKTANAQAVGASNSSQDRNVLINRYKQKPDGYLANYIANNYLLDSLNQESVKQALDWLRKGYESHNDLLCAIDLSNIYLFGWYRVKKNEAKGLSMLAKAMESVAQKPTLVESYDEKTEDPDEADEIVDKILSGFYILGSSYMDGFGAVKNEKQGIYWYEKGKTFQDPFCAMALGDFYYNGGKVVPKNQALALKNYEIAAEAQYAEAIVKAAKMYLDGIGTAKNHEKGIHLLRKASALANKQAKDLLAKLGEI